MNSERIKILEQFVKEEPHDPFNRYALGLELSKSDKFRAKEIFDQLLTENPDYVPSYYQAALLYNELFLRTEATVLIATGIDHARNQNNVKAARELRALLEDGDF